MSNTNFHFFWNGPFSNWHLCPVVVRGFEFNCVEQYFMTAKAMAHNQNAIAGKIVLVSDPREQKALGRTIPNFNKNMWTAVCRDIMFRGNFAKFSQNPELKSLLLSTKGTILVEASPYDRLWGIGLAADNPDAQDPSKWRGNNWLGRILNEIRDGFLS